MTSYVKVWKVYFPDQYDDTSVGVKYRAVVLDAVGIVAEELGVFPTKEAADEAKLNWLEFNESI